MKVEELIKRLRRFPKDAEVFNGDFIKITEVMVKFEEDRAYSRACTDG